MAGRSCDAWRSFSERFQDSSGEVAGDVLTIDLGGQHDYNK